MTIMMETGPITRFPRVGNYVSYCRKVSSQWLSNAKRKARGNEKNGSPYLAWAFAEAAELAVGTIPLCGPITSARPRGVIAWSLTSRWPINWPGRPISCYGTRCPMTGTVCLVKMWAGTGTLARRLVQPLCLIEPVPSP